ncbi:HoxN/HupN/NixA family nickel/cobalt transporter [Pedococcus sp. NPDC057267]|uniref:HoxN/HupN/NixA family nickel/cobalt transporter n=1 Tax=Pedococcus sp. NPDC057267 TaxID=3346077 RepID=UPI003634F93E
MASYGAVILLMHVVGFGLLVFLIAPRHLTVGSQVFGLGLGITAYVFGLRHAFDADHIAAIDNTTRKLMAGGGRPKSVGFWFAMGHSGMVFVLTALMALGARAAVYLTGDDSTVHVVLSTIGTLVSGGFLVLIGLLNLVALVGIWRLFRGMRHGVLDELALERHLDARGFLSRLLGRVGRAIRHPWQMLPLGMLFGLGFDTASEVALLVLAGTGAASGLPWYAVLVLPLLFAAGMSLLDFLDGVFMTVAYDWAFAHPVRKIYYNLAVTGLSVAVAVVIGSVELLSVLHERFGLDSWAMNWVADVDLGSIGFVVVGLFVVVWAVAVGYWRLARVEERWATEPEQG